ncbi:MAG: glycosyltransferase family 39 protein [Anaerolineae bacterium]|nr:glycosyltransferase family 39 protein [Anaerolineae bacterium]
MILLLALVFAVRVWDLPHVPPGITHDEASNGHDSAAILAGEHRIYFPVGYGHEPLYNYSVAAVTALLGQSIFTLRITTVGWGMLQVVVTTALARRWWGRTAALAVAAAYAASFWSLMMARVGLRAPALPALLAASVLLYDHAIHPPVRRPGRPAAQTARDEAERPAETRPRGHRPPSERTRLPTTAYYAASGVFLGASLYTYMASRGMPFLYVTFAVVLAILNRRRLKAVWLGTVSVLLIAALLSVPLFIYLYRHPDLEQRIGQLGAAITALPSGDWRPLLGNIADSMPMMLLHGDPQWLYNIAGRPGLEPLLAVFFLVGLVFALRQWRSEPVLLTLIWLLGGLAPALLVSVDYNLLHAIAAMPAAMLLIGAGFAWIARHRVGAGRWWRVAQGAIAAITFVAFAATVVESTRAYFVVWSGNRNARVAYHHHVVALGRYLAESAENGPAVITSLYPAEVHDPYVMEVTLGSQDPELRWSDGRTALFVPAERTRLFIEEQTQPVETLWRWVAPDLVPLTTLRFRDIDIPSRIDGYTWDAEATWRRLMAQGNNSFSVAPGDPPPTTQHTTARGPVGFGDTVTLTGYLAEPHRVRAGEDLPLLTAWQVTSGTPLELVVFAHLLTAEGDLITQDDRLDAPSWQWQPGDRWIHVHRFALPQDPPEGDYLVALGLYDRATSDRLHVSTTPSVPAPGATRVLIPLEIDYP